MSRFKISFIKNRGKSQNRFYFVKNAFNAVLPSEIKHINAVKLFQRQLPCFGVFSVNWLTNPLDTAEHRLAALHV